MPLPITDIYHTMESLRQKLSLLVSISLMDYLEMPPLSSLELLLSSMEITSTVGGQLEPSTTELILSEEHSNSLELRVVSVNCWFSLFLSTREPYWSPSTSRGHLKSEGDASITRGDYLAPSDNDNCASYPKFFKQLLDLVSLSSSLHLDKLWLISFLFFLFFFAGLRDEHRCRQQVRDLDGRASKASKWT